MEKYVNEYKVTVVTKYNDGMGERESKKEKVVLAEDEEKAKSQVVKPAKMTTQTFQRGDKIIEKGHWNSRASQFITNTQITVELIKEKVIVID